MQVVSLDHLCKQAMELNSISPVVIDLINIIDDPKTKKSKIVSLVALDEILNAHIFKLVNSAAFGLKKSPRSLAEAVDFIGLRQLQDLAFFAAAQGVFVDEELWYRSVFAANSSQKIARMLNKTPGCCSNIYMAALMCSLGSVVFKCFHKDSYTDLCLEKDLRTRLEMEKLVFGVNHIELSYIILKDSGLPKTALNILKSQFVKWDDPGFTEENAIIELVLSIELKDFIDEYDLESSLNYKMLEKFNLNKFNIDLEFINKLHAAATEIINL